MIRYIRDEKTGNKFVWLVYKDIVNQSCCLVSYSRRFGNYLNEGVRGEIIKKVQCVFVIIIVQNI